ncbi:MAG: hypothetical protein K8U03_18715 [Planctomycetia bacterium]|nr:hypothetical protein [Planctomycetia bacterium]
MRYVFAALVVGFGFIVGPSVVVAQQVFTEQATSPTQPDATNAAPLIVLPSDVAQLPGLAASAPSVPQLGSVNSEINLASTGAFAPDVPVKEEVTTAKFNSLEKKVNDFIQGATGTTYPTVKINGVFQADAGFFQQDDQSIARYGRVKDGADVRRFRLAASGAISEVHNYFMQVDFGFFGRPTIQDLWVEQTALPILGTVRVGQWKQPFSLEVVSSFRYTTFVERSTLFQSFTPFRHLGIGFYNNSEDMMSTWAGSMFAAGQDQYAGSVATAGGIGTAERFTHLLHYDEESGGRYYTHIGAAHYFSAPNDHSATFRTIPEVFIGSQGTAAPNTVAGQQPLPGNVTGTPFFVNTGALAVNNFNVIGSEFLWVNGPLSFQTESMVNMVNRTNNASSLYFTGSYAQVGYFLTGEHRPYDRKAGAIDRIRPHTNFIRVRRSDGEICRGPGAWELASRVSNLRLNDNDVRGGTITDFTQGINWYLNAYLKAQFNYIHSMSYNAASTQANTDIYDFRVQIDF